jgi:CheY-like chemotaxis protein
LVLLDLNMPRVDIWQVLARIKTDESLREIPVVVLTSSQAETDVAASYASAYVTKPLTAETFAAVVRQVGAFFTDVVKLPH